MAETLKIVDLGTQPYEQVLVLQLDLCRQRQHDDSAPIARLGRAEGANAFLIAARAHTPLGVPASRRSGSCPGISSLSDLEPVPPRTSGSTSATSR